MMTPEARRAAALKAAATRRANLGLPPAGPKPPKAPAAPKGPRWSEEAGAWMLKAGGRVFLVSSCSDGTWRARYAPASAFDAGLGVPLWLIEEDCPNAAAARAAVSERLRILGLPAPAPVAEVA